MSVHKSAPARVLAACLVLLGATATGAVLAQDAEPVASRSDAEANPVDAGITTLSSSYLKRGSKARIAKKLTNARSSGNSATNHRNLLRGYKLGTVRNSVGQSIQQASVGVKEPGVRPSELVGADVMSKNTSAAANGPGTVGTATHRQGFVPIQAGRVTPRDPRLNTAMNSSIINGRDMVRPGSGAGVIGGAPKHNSGILSGTNFLHRNP